MLGESWKSVERGSCWWSVSVSLSQSVSPSSQSQSPTVRSREEAGQLLVSVSSLDTVTIFSPSGISHPRNYFGIRSGNHWSPDSKLFYLHLILEIYSQVQPFYYPGNNQGNVLKKVLKTQFSSSKIQWKNPAAAFPAVSHIWKHHLATFKRGAGFRDMQMQHPPLNKLSYLNSNIFARRR